MSDLGYWLGGVSSDAPGSSGPGDAAAYLAPGVFAIAIGSTSSQNAKPRCASGRVALRLDGAPAFLTTSSRVAAASGPEAIASIIGLGQIVGLRTVRYRDLE